MSEANFRIVKVESATTYYTVEERKNVIKWNFTWDYKWKPIYGGDDFVIEFFSEQEAESHIDRIIRYRNPKESIVKEIKYIYGEKL